MNFPMHRMWRAFFFLTLVLGGLAVWGMQIYAEREQRFRHQVETGVKTTSELTIRSLVEWRRRLQASANAISDDGMLANAVQDWLSLPSPWRETPLADRLRSLVERGGFTNAMLLTVDGDVLMTSAGGVSDLPMREMHAMAAAQESAQAVFIEPYDNANFAYPSLSVLAPLFVGNQSVGIIWLIVDLRATLFPLLDLWRAASMSSENLLMQRDGDAIFHINPLRYGSGKPLDKFSNISDLHLVAVQAFHGLRGVIYGKDYRNQSVLAVLGMVPDSPWMLVTKIDEIDAFSAQQRKDGVLLGLSVGLVILAFFSMAFFLIWRLVGQERRLTIELQRNMRWLERAQQTASLGLFSIDVKKRDVTLSTMGANILGFTKDINISVNQLQSMFHKDDVENAIRSKLKNIELNKVFQTSFRIFPNNGLRPKWIEVWCEYENMESEKKLIGTIQDISLRKKVEEELESYRRSLENQVRKDPLTGLANRFALDEAINIEWLRARRGVQEISLLMLDIDYFKGYNDLYGHLEGDQCLKNVARKILATVARQEDLVARYGGEEFAILLPSTGEHGALQIAKKLCHAIEKMQMEHLASPVYKIVTISVGVASAAPVYIQDLAEQEDAIRQLFEKADSALYQAKNQGRNRVSVFQEQAKLKHQVSEN